MQTADPERVTYDWAFRDDGGTALDPSDPAVASGTTKDARRIDVRGLGGDWSIAEGGFGWLYHARAPGAAVAPDDVRLCVTDARDFTGLDAADPRWVLRASLTDDGVR